MSDPGPATQDSTPPRPPLHAAPSADRDLRSLGAAVTDALLHPAGRPGALQRELRSIAAAASRSSGHDAEVHRILVDVGVAHEHLDGPRPLRAYASARRRTVAGPAARALLDGVLGRLEQVGDGPVRLA
ncbi:unannotated protein [freshwater metagenome]|uniref:Unannotated protein n=1 Tax=freshwater metagenome TaxID=449393 RepID=A0A6J7H5P7_9ZZZZ|nr:hypothetical protein [Actinomycetota bacterium]